MTVLKEQLKEIVDLVALVPDQFKNQCFELLLKEAIEHARPTRVKAPTPPVDQNTKQADSPEGEGAKRDGSSGDGGNADEITASDLHVKTKKMLERAGISVSDLNELFYKEGDSIKSLVEDYKSNKMAEIQIRIALFQAFHNGLVSGDFKTTVEDVRSECSDRKAIDSSNWSANFKKRSSLFDFGEFSREVVDLRLSEEGRQELAVLLKSLI